MVRAILEYVRETAREYGVDPHIRFGHRVIRADWFEPGRTVDCAVAAHRHRGDGVCALLLPVRLQRVLPL